MKKENSIDIIETDSEKNIGYEIGKTSSYIRVAVIKLLKEAGITQVTNEQFGILFLLSQQDGLYQRQLSVLLSKDRPNISRMIDILDKKGLVTRRTHPDNKRISKAYITEAGLELVKLLLPYKNAFKEKICKDIKDEEMDICFSVLAKIRKNLEDSCNMQI